MPNDRPVYESFCAGSSGSRPRIEAHRASDKSISVTFNLASGCAVCARTCGVACLRPLHAACHAAKASASLDVPLATDRLKRPAQPTNAHSEALYQSHTSGQLLVTLTCRKWWEEGRPSPWLVGTAPGNIQTAAGSRAANLHVETVITSSLNL